MSSDAELDLAGRLTAERFVQDLRAARAARPGRSALFPKLGDARMRRQIVRWIGREYRESTPGILETLRVALEDDDWEVRATAMLVAARLGAAPLRSTVNDVALPSAHQHGLGARDARLLLAVRQIAVEALNAANDGNLASAIERRLPGAPRELVHLVLGDEPLRRDRTWLFLYALATPSVLEDPLPDPPPAGIVVRDRHPMLGGTVAMAWVSPVPHILGDDLDDEIVSPPIREYTPAAGFFIARRPLSVELLHRLGVGIPVQSAAQNPAIGERLACTPDAPIIVSHDDAIGLCEAIARRTGAEVTLPTADELECAARGTDGRRYPWGNGLERLDGSERSSHGIERFAVPAAQWSSSRGPSGTPLVLGGPTSARCSGRFPRCWGLRRATGGAGSVWRRVTAALHATTKVRAFPTVCSPEQLERTN